MNIEVVPAGRHAARGAEFVAGSLRDAVAARGRGTVAFSGGSTAGPLLEALAGTDVPSDVPWSELDVFQVDERVAPDGHPDRNLNTLRRCLIDRIALPPERLHAMPVAEDDLDAAAVAYAETLLEIAGRPPTIDVVHLGLGADGHTASLVPGLAVPLSDDADPVIVAPSYEGRRRLTLTPPVLSRAREVLWFVSGAAKAPAVRLLVEGDRSIPAASVETSHGLLLLDPAAAAELDT